MPEQDEVERSKETKKCTKEKSPRNIQQNKNLKREA